MKPAVSVVLPVRNGRRWLRQAVDSVLSQTLGSLELIVVDPLGREKTIPIRPWAPPIITLGGRQAPRSSAPAKRSALRRRCTDSVEHAPGNRPAENLVRRRFRRIDS